MSLTLPISETFTSIQGEGGLTGTPSHFIRVSGCNLRCAWCDTPYASWSPEGEQHPIQPLIDESIAAKADHVVVTGGEPMLFPNIVPLCAGLTKADLHVTIETAGTVIPPGWSSSHCDLMSISPKLANSTPKPGDPRDPEGGWRRRHDQRRLDLDVMRGLITIHPDRQLKFVVTGPADLPEIDALLDQLAGAGLEPHEIMLMPEGVGVPEPSRVEWVQHTCDQRGWTYCKRLHIELFGNTRGT